MYPDLPTFHLDDSPLLRAILDDRVAQVWEFWGEGAYPSTRHLKDEVDARVQQVLDTWSDAELEEFATHDSWVRAGLADAGSVHEGDDRSAHRLRRVATRVVERGLGLAEHELSLRTLADPEPEARAFRAVPGLWEALSSRDYLLALTPERVPTDTSSDDPYIEFDGFGLFPNPYLREARELFWELCELARDERLQVKVAIDPFRVVPIDEVQMKFLKDYWFGARLTRENLDSTEPHHLGRTFHRRDLASEKGGLNQIAYPLIGTSFDWSLREETIKILQVEEVRQAPSERLIGGPVTGRYLHSERDTIRHAFTHLDGAIKGFDAAEHRPSELDPLAPRPKASRYRKLFRVDGEMRDEDWGMVVGHFFRDNELIAEYFGELVDERVPQA